MATKLSLNIQFQRADGRAEFDKVRNALKASLLEDGVEDGAARLLDLGAALDTGVARMKRDLLGSSLCWNEDNQLVTAWIHQQHRKIIEMGTRVIHAMRRGEPAAALRTRVLALTLFHWGEALKWIPGRERQEYTPLHDMLQLSMAGGGHRESLNWVADGRCRSVTIEALYFRALLLDRFASGNLTRQQVEVLDAWLWEWAAYLKAGETDPGSASLRVDLDENAGLRDGRREGEGRSLYLPLGPLESQRRLLIKELHRGRIVPTHGCTAEFRIEEHVAVIDHLGRAFNPRADRGPERAARQREAATRIEVWVGLPEILARGAGVKVGTETGKWRALSLAEPSRSADLKDAGQPVRYENADPAKRYLWLSDTSATGRGFEALEADAAGIELGDLVGWRRAASGPMMLGRVIRRLPSATQGQVFLGVQLLTETALPFRLARADAFDCGSADTTFLFVPGDDASGRRDAFLLPETTYQQQYSYHALTGDEAYTIKFNRVRNKGRGWILAGFEVVPAKRVEVATTSSSKDPPAFELVLEERFDDPWGPEVSPRLQL
jgi:hypothetical protein